MKNGRIKDKKGTMLAVMLLLASSAMSVFILIILFGKTPVLLSEFDPLFFGFLGLMSFCGTGLVIYGLATGKWWDV